MGLPGGVGRLEHLQLAAGCVSKMHAGVERGAEHRNREECVAFLSWPFVKLDHFVLCVKNDLLHFLHTQKQALLVLEQGLAG